MIYEDENDLGYFTTPRSERGPVTREKFYSILSAQTWWHIWCAAGAAVQGYESRAEQQRRLAGYGDLP